MVTSGEEAANRCERRSARGEPMRRGIVCARESSLPSPKGSLYAGAVGEVDEGKAGEEGVEEKAPVEKADEGEKAAAPMSAEPGCKAAVC